MAKKKKMYLVQIQQNGGTFDDPMAFEAIDEQSAIKEMVDAYGYPEDEWDNTNVLVVEAKGNLYKIKHNGLTFNKITKEKK